MALIVVARGFLCIAEVIHVLANVPSLLFRNICSEDEHQQSVFESLGN